MCSHVISRSSVSCDTQQPAEQLEPVWNSPATGGWWRTHTRIKQRKTSAQQLFTALHKPVEDGGKPRQERSNKNETLHSVLLLLLLLLLLSRCCSCIIFILAVWWNIQTLKWFWNVVPHFKHIYSKFSHIWRHICYLYRLQDLHETLKSSQRHRQQAEDHVSVNRWLINIRHDRPQASDLDENGSFVN